MKIKSIHLIEFGFFKDRTFDFKDGFNIIIGKNETGKTTLRNSIDAVLYSFIDSEAKRKIYKKEYDIYKSGSYKASIKLSYKGRDYVVERDLLNETCRVFDDRNNDITSSFSLTNKILTPGNDFTDLDANVFREFCNINTVNGEISDSSSVLIKENLNSNLIDEAINKIKLQNEDIGSDRSWQRKRPLLNNRIDSLKESIEAGERELQKHSLKNEKSKELEENILKCENRLLKLRKRENENIKIKEEISSKQDDKKVTPYIIILGVIVGLISFFRDYMSRTIFFISLIFSFIIFLILIYVNIKILKNKRKQKNRLKYLNSINEELILINKKISEVEDEKNVYIKEMAFIEGQRENLKETAEQVLLDKDKLAIAISDKEKLDKIYYINNLTIDALNYVKSKNSEAPKTRVIQYAREIFKYITANDELLINDDLKLYLQKSQRLDKNSFSMGTLETAIFSLKLSFNNFLSKDGIIILDDAFLYVDDDRLEKICEILYNISSKKQILYFTSNKRLLEIMSQKYYNINEVIV